MFAKLCVKLCLHTRTSRIVFFSSITFIAVITVLAALYFYEPQAIIPPPAIRDFRPQELLAEFQQEFGIAEGEAFFLLVRTHVVFGDALLQEYTFLRRGEGSGRAMTTSEVTAAFAEEQRRWQAEATKLVATSSQMVRAVAEDLTEAQQLAKEGLTGWAPFINQRVVKSRSMFHDLAQVLLAEEKSNQYYGETRLGRLLEKRVRPE